MSLHGKSLALIIALTGLATGAPGTASAQKIAQAQPVVIAGPTHCTIEKRRGIRINSELPAKEPVYWREMPMSVTCGTPGNTGTERTVRMPRDRWLPLTFIIDEMVIAHLDPKTGYRYRKPARMTLSLYPKMFASHADRERWYNERKSIIEEAHKYRVTYIQQQDVACHSRLTCGDLIEEQDDRKAEWLKDLDNLKAKTSILPPGAVTKKPARAEIQDRDGKLCLTKQADGTWRSRPCTTTPPDIRRIVVNGKEECIARIDTDTWESRPCP